MPVVLGCAFDPNTTTIGPGDGGDTIIDHGSGPYTIYTGLSDDTITVNTGNLNDPSQGGTIYDYNGQDDTIDVNGPIKSGAVNTIQAVGFGSQPAVSGDTITGGPGDDDITVTGSVNLIDSGGGDDNITFTGNPDFDTVVAHDGDNGELTITGLPNANVGNALHVYGTGGQDTLSADDAFNTIPNSHGLYVTAASGSGNSATLESIYAVDSSNQSGISDLVLDATGGDPSTTATAGSLTYVPPSGDIHVNVDTVTNAGVSSVEVNSFASAFPSPNANPTILTISGVPGASVLNFDTEPSTASAGSGTTTTSTVSGTSFTTTISNGTATLETIIFGEALFRPDVLQLCQSEQPGRHRGEREVAGFADLQLPQRSGPRYVLREFSRRLDHHQSKWAQRGRSSRQWFGQRHGPRRCAPPGQYRRPRGRSLQPDRLRRCHPADFG